MSAHSSDAAAIEGYLTHLKGSRGRRPRTLEAYGACLARLQEFMQGRALLEAQADELEAFCGIWLHKRGVVARSRKPYISAVRGFYAWAAKCDLVSVDAGAGLLHPKTAKPMPEAMSLRNAEKLMWAPDLATFIGLRDAAMLALLIGCGLRVSGLVNLDVENLRNEELDGKPRLSLRVVEKGEKERLLPVPREAEMLVRTYLDHEQLATYDRLLPSGRRVLFVNARNTRVPAHEYRGEAVRMSRKSVWKLIQRYGEAVGIPEAERHPHALRHLFGAELGEDDVNLIMRGELLGHSDPKTTAIYDGLAMRRKTKVMDATSPLGKIKTPVTELLRRLG